MKKFYLFLLAVAVSTGAFAQMQIWSNGTIIFSHDQSSVDSISFGSPMHVQANMQSATPVSSLAGSVYVSSLSGAHYGTGSSGSSSASTLITLCFVDESNGYYTRNNEGRPGIYGNLMVEFTYSISGVDIIINISNEVKYGKLIGKNAIVAANWSDSYPATFLNYNR